MKLRSMAAAAGIGTLLLFGGTAPMAGAQEVAQGAEAEDDGGFDDWGLLGLLGLVGLAGLAGRKRDDRRATAR